MTNIYLSPELEQWINKKVQSGQYASPGKVLRAGLYPLKDYDELACTRREHLRAEILKGLTQYDSSKFVTCDSALLERIKTKGRRRLAECCRTRKSVEIETVQNVEKLTVAAFHAWRGFRRQSS